VRELAGAERIGRFMQALGAVAEVEGTCSFTGGATAVLLGWRATTVDIDLVLAPERDELLRALPRLKDELRINVELASPADFVPLPSGWRERAVSITREGRLVFFHFDPYSQALAKLERAHDRDLGDVRALLAAGLIEPGQLLASFDEIELELFRFPAIDPRAFRRRVENALLPSAPEAR